MQIEHLVSDSLDLYGKLGAATLAKAHARSGDRIALASRMRVGKPFGKAIASFAMTWPINRSAITSGFSMLFSQAA